MKNITILGVSGSIGTQTLDVLRNQPKEFRLLGISAYNNENKVKEIINEFHPSYVTMMDETARKNIEFYCKENKMDVEVLSGIEGLSFIASLKEVDLVVTSIVGMVGLIPTLSAIKAGKDIALANKETLVVAGEFVMKEAKKYGVRILPVDSEHGAIFQCLKGEEISKVSRLLLTASGGPFRGFEREQLLEVAAREALKHPKWNMGKKISIDSATLMNKGLEVIEAHWLFGCEYKNIEVVVHPQSIIHSMVDYVDGSVIAQLADTDMRLPIQYALNFPERKENIVKRLDFKKMSELTFEEPDLNTFPCLRLAYEAGKSGMLMPTILNGANEVCVKLFLEDKISFYGISDIIEECMLKFDANISLNVDNIIDMDKKVRNYILKKYDY